LYNHLRSLKGSFFISVKKNEPYGSYFYFRPILDLTFSSVSFATLFALRAPSLATSSIIDKAFLYLFWMFLRKITTSSATAFLNVP